MASYHAFNCNLAAQRIDFSGKIVLELGADRDLVAAEELRGLGARLVVASNRAEHWTSAAPKEGILLCTADANSLTQRFGPATIDCVIGIAVLEHISPLDKMFSQAFAILKPGGYLYLHGAPIWSSAYGHHLWMDLDGATYRFNDAARNPIEPWEHLAFDRAELAGRLGGRVPADHVTPILDKVFTSPALNRATYGDILRAARASRFSIVAVDEMRSHEPDEGTRDWLRRRHAGEGRFEVSGLRLTMQRTG